MRKIALALALTMACSMPALADERTDRIKEIKTQIAELESELAELEAEETMSESGENTGGAETVTKGNTLPGVNIIETDDDLTIVDAGYNVTNGYLTFAVIFHNNSTDTAYEFPTVTITARDENGSVIGTDDAVGMVVYPEQDYSMATLAFSIEQEPTTVDFEASYPDYGIKSVSTMEHPDYIPLEVIDANPKNETFGGYSFVGEVENKNDYDIDSAAVVVLFRNEDGALVGGDTTYIDNVKAGRKKAFELSHISEKMFTDTYQFEAHPW